MTDATVPSPAPKKRRRWLRRLAWCAGVLLVLLVVVYFVVTSSAFFTGVILPRAGKALNAEITVSDASISPFKQVLLRNLKVQTTGAEPLVAAPEVLVRYSLTDILGGKIHADEIVLSSPTVVLVENPDGTSNLDPILKALVGKPTEAKKAAPPPSAKPAQPTQIELRKLALTDATVRKVKLYAGGNRDVAELSKINVTLEDVKNGQTGKLALSADIRVENHPPVPATNGLLQARLNGSFTFALTPDAKPASIKGNTHLEITRAEGALAQGSALVADLESDVTPTEIKQVALRFQKGSTPLAELRVSGPFDMEKTEGNFVVEVRNIDKQLLDLAGASSGLEFGPTTFNCTNTIDLAKAGSVITAGGQLDLAKLQLTRAQVTTPQLDFRASYSVTVDRAQGTALVRGLTLSGTERGQALLRADLTSPMQLAWGNVTNAIGDSAFNLNVTNLDLADWKPFLGELAPAGMVNARMKLLSQQAGKQLTFDLNSQIDNLTASFGSNQITRATVVAQASGVARDLKQFDLSRYKLEVAQQSQPLVTLTGSGTYVTTNKNADLQVTLQAVLTSLVRAFPQPDVNVSSGTAELKGRLTQKQDAQTITGSLALADFTGRCGKNDFRKFGTTADLDIGMTPQQVQVRKLSGKLGEGGNPGGSFDLSGTYDLTSKSAQLAARLTDFNQNGLRPFLEPLLADKKLVSVAINANANAQYNPQGDSTVKADLQVTNLVVSDPKNQFPATPLAAKMQVDASVHKQVADVRQFQVALTPTARATNQVQLSGQVDMSNTNAIQGNLKLAADSLDLTSYYDLFAGEGKAPEKKAAPTASKSARAPQPAAATGPPAVEKEPEATQLPFRNFAAAANIGRLYLREVEVSDFQTTAKVDGGHVALNPFKLTLNGAPVNVAVDLDMGVPGYKYDVSCDGHAIPMAPLVNSFQPDRKGQIGGTLTAGAKVSGTGTTGASLQKTLAGQFDVASTNLNLSVINLRWPPLKVLVNVVASIPELINNRDHIVSSVFQSMTGKGGGGLADELNRSPIDAITARGTIGGGTVNLQQTVVQSPAFEAEATGTITLAPVLTNSTLQIPVSISLSRPIAERIRVAAADTPTNAAYAKLPDFLTMRGTVGQPDPKYNQAVLAGMAVKALTGGGHGGGKVGDVLQGLGGLLGGKPPAGTNAPSATATNQNQSPVGNLLDQLLKPKK